MYIVGHILCPFPNISKRELPHTENRVGHEGKKEFLTIELLKKRGDCPYESARMDPFGQNGSDRLLLSANIPRHTDAGIRRC